MHVGNSGHGLHQAIGGSAKGAASPECRPHPDNSAKPQITVNLSFKFGSAALAPEAKQTLRGLAESLNGERKDVKLMEIDGHTDAVGTYDYNKRLSQLRAEAVRDFLVREMSVDAKRLKAVGQSYCSPADPAHPDAATNRRVVFVTQSS